MNIQQAQDRLDDIDQHGQDLSEWELEFVDSLLGQTDRGEAPSEKQAAIINRIWIERVGR